MPDYFDAHATDTNGDGTVDAKDTPKWPDPTGGAAGYWTTPSPGPVGDADPKTKAPEELYDRIVHNLYSINIVWEHSFCYSWPRLPLSHSAYTSNNS